MKPSLEVLLDIDHLSEQQQEDVKTMTYWELDIKGENHWLVLYYSNGLENDTCEYGIDSEDSIDFYKLLMLDVIEKKAIQVKDNDKLEFIKEVLSSSRGENESEYEARFFRIGNKDVLVKNALEIKAQQLYKAVTIIKELGLL